ncbi:MAG: hypothetical protein GXP55_20865 [Deltaproteobacteria bacterium]|nr:hypothetical protein [Deltaproteobacteria bacterium]
MAVDEDAASALEDDDMDSHILAVHLGHAANCSSVGSVVDFLFVSAVAGAALLAAVVATLDSATDDSESADPQQGGADGDVSKGVAGDRNSA